MKREAYPGQIPDVQLETSQVMNIALIASIRLRLGIVLLRRVVLAVGNVV